MIVNELPVVDISGTTEICNEDVTQIYFDFTAGQAPWTLSYDINGTTSTPFPLNNNLDSISVSPSITSLYNFTNITDVNNCSNSLTDSNYYSKSITNSSSFRRWRNL